MSKIHEWVPIPPKQPKQPKSSFARWKSGNVGTSGSGNVSAGPLPGEFVGQTLKDMARDLSRLWREIISLQEALDDKTKALAERIEFLEDENES